MVSSNAAPVRHGGRGLVFGSEENRDEMQYVENGTGKVIKEKMRETQSSAGVEGWTNPIIVLLGKM